MATLFVVFVLLICGLAVIFFGLSAWDSIRYRAKRRQVTTTPGLHINYLYLLHWAKMTTASKPDAKVLDYGCGSGKVVAAARQLGLDVYGADIYYDASTAYKDEVKKLGLFGDVIREISNGRLGFDDSYFDLITSNQVFEHVEDMDNVLDEIHRVMKKGAIFLCLFPSKGVIREGHIGIPFAHWFPKGSRLRYFLTLAFRCLGIGYVKPNHRTKRQWTKDALAWIDNYTVYRDKDEIFRTFSRFFEIKLIEDDYIKYRLLAQKNTEPFAKLLAFPLVPQISRVLFRRVAGMVIFAKKPEEISAGPR